MSAVVASGLSERMVSRGYAAIVLERLGRQAAEITGARRCSICICDRDDPGRMIVAAAYGENGDVVGTRIRPRALADTTGTTMPLLWDGEMRGALTVNHQGARRRFARREPRALSALCRVVASAIGHAGARSELTPLVEARVRRLANALDESDAGTASHSDALVDLVEKVGPRAGLSDAGLAELRLAALFHDVGKVAVPPEVLNKPGALDARERAIMRNHPDWGADMLAGVPGLEAIATIVRYHHERWDGRGYPDGLKGMHIPLASRVIAVCDAYHAMTSDRPYRRALTHSSAVHELQAAAGSQFDPTVVQQLELSLAAAPCATA